MNDETQSNPPKAFCWTACEAFTWVAFRKVWKVGSGWELPEAQWSRSWKQWPEPWLYKAFLEMETGTPWKRHAKDWPPPDKKNTRAHARLMMAAYPNESAQVLRDAFETDTKQHERNEAAFLQAWRDVMEAVKDGRVTVWARPASRKGAPKLSARHVKLDLAWFMGPRVIDMFGWLVFDERAGTWFDTVKYEGPWFDEARFSEAELREHWPAVPLVPPDVSAWMLQAATAYLAKEGRPAKKDDLVSRCRVATACTDRQAKAAYSKLPDHLRKPKGKPRQ